MPRRCSSLHSPNHACVLGRCSYYNPAAAAAAAAGPAAAAASLFYPPPAAAGAAMTPQAAAVQQQQQAAAAAAAALLASGYNGAASEVPGAAAAMLSTFTQQHQQVAFSQQGRTPRTDKTILSLPLRLLPPWSFYVYENYRAVPSRELRVFDLFLPEVNLPPPLINL